MLSINAAWVTAALSASDGTKAGRVRFGVTVGKRNARRSVDRTLVKRIVREAFRHRAAAFEDCAAQASAHIDIALRLKAPLVNKHGVPIAMRAWRRQVRAEADGLLQEVLNGLAGRATTTIRASTTENL